MSNPNVVYIIKNKQTDELFTARSGKSSWKQPGHAKNAWNQSFFRPSDVESVGMEMIPDPSHWNLGRMRCPLFSEQTVFEVVELKHETLTDLEKAVVLLKGVLGRCDSDNHNEIVEFLGKFK